MCGPSIRNSKPSSGRLNQDRRGLLALTRALTPLQLLDLCLRRCPGLPLPPYASSLSLRSNMEYTPLDEALPGSDIRRALEAAVLLDNELGV
jgi:hypothetical protein